MIDPAFLDSPTLLADLRRAFSWLLPAKRVDRRGRAVPPPHAPGAPGAGRPGPRRPAAPPAARRKVADLAATRTYSDPAAGLG